MKLLKAALFALIFSLVPAYAYSASLGDLRVNYLAGDVQVKTADTSEWVPASINMPLMSGDALWVPEGGRAGIQLRDGTYVRLNENSSFEVLTIGNDSFQFYLSLGHAYVNFRGRQGTLFQMDTPVSSSRAYDRARFRVDVSDNGFTDVSVFNGAVFTEGRNGKTRVTAGNILSVGGDTYAELAPLGPADDWERWNREMDRKLEKRYSTRYLPSELSPYSYDFDEYGKWVYVRDYGYCWTPTVISVGWAPYRLGRWTWIGGDYVWVSYDPWGWAPYHYGRWAFGASIGWCWVPPVRGAVYWGPGFVGWVNTGDFVAWVPLAPGEIYYGHGYYGPHSVNVTNININTVNITNVYKNVHVNNGITVVHRDTFITGQRFAVDAGVVTRIREHNFVARKITVGGPSIAPTKASYMPVVKSIPASKEPPQRIRQIQVNQLRESRPIVKNPAQSVLRPGATLKPMSVTTLREPRRPGTAVQAPGIQPRTTGREVQKPSGAPTGREVQKPSGAPTGREVQKPSGAPIGREVQKPSGAPTGREVQKPSGAPAPKETVKEGTKPSTDKEKEEQQRQQGVPGRGR